MHAGHKYYKETRNTYCFANKFKVKLIRRSLIMVYPLRNELYSATLNHRTLFKCKCYSNQGDRARGYST